MVAIILYIIALFFLGLGNAVATYHVLRYRDPGDASTVILAVYYVLVFGLIIGTTFLIDWNELFNS